MRFSASFVAGVAGFTTLWLGMIPSVLASEAIPAGIEASRERTNQAEVIADPEDLGESLAPASQWQELESESDQGVQAELDVSNSPDVPAALDASGASETAAEYVSSPESPARSEIDYDLDRPRYQRLRPSVGIAVSGAWQALGGTDIVPEVGGASIRSVDIRAEYLFPGLQSIGVIGLGATASVYPIASASSVANSNLSLWGVGLTARYQARFFTEQFLVPTFAYDATSFRYIFSSGKSGRTNLTGPSFGVWILINALDSESAGNFYSNWGGKRTYLTAEMKTLSGGDGVITVSGASYYAGLRIEL